MNEMRFKAQYFLDNMISSSPNLSNLSSSFPVTCTLHLWGEKNMHLVFIKIFIDTTMILCRYLLPEMQLTPHISLFSDKHVQDRTELENNDAQFLQHIIHLLFTVERAKSVLRISDRILTEVFFFSNNYPAFDFTSINTYLTIDLS